VSENADYAQALARHVKAALLHLRQADRLAELAGIDIDASEHQVPEAGLLRAAGDATQDLDLWTSGNAPARGASRAGTYRHTERWCHAEGGSLPAGSWPPEPGRPDPGTTKAVLRSELGRRRQEREAWEETAQACTCPPGLCSRGDFRDHRGESDGCMVCGSGPRSGSGSGSGPALLCGGDPRSARARGYAVSAARMDGTPVRVGHDHNRCRWCGLLAAGHEVPGHGGPTRQATHVAWPGGETVTTAAAEVAIYVELEAMKFRTGPVSICPGLDEEES
jgi:hypothetical protein